MLGEDRIPPMTAINDPILVINLWEPLVTCSRCGKDTLCKWGFPVDESGRIIPTWAEEWSGGIPACKECYEFHQKWSEEVRKS